MREREEIVKALQCSAAAEGTTDCTGCLYLVVDQGPEVEALIGRPRLGSCNVDRIALDAADLLKAYAEDHARLTVERDAAAKCIVDIETYMMLGSTKYVMQTIESWHGLQKENL